MPTRNSHTRFILIVKHLRKNTKLNNYNWSHHHFLMDGLSDLGQNRNSRRNFKAHNSTSDLWERSASFILYLTIMKKLTVCINWSSL